MSRKTRCLKHPVGRPPLNSSVVLHFVVMGCICITKLVLSSNFNDVCLHNYEVLDYGLICKITQNGV